MKDNRIAVDGTIYLSAVLSKDQALSWFEYFHKQIGLSIYLDEARIFYYKEKSVSYWFIKENWDTIEDTIGVVSSSLE